jgi:uncharacterized protein YcfL
MRYILASLMLAGCASPPQTPAFKSQEIMLDQQIHAMSRNEVIMAVRECESSGLRAVVINGKRKINGFTTDIVVDVTCAPRFMF